MITDDPDTTPELPQSRQGTPQSNNQLDNTDQIRKQIRETLFNWHQRRDYYYSDLKEQVITDAEWKVTRDKIDDEAIDAIEALITSIVAKEVLAARIDELTLAGYAPIYGPQHNQHRYIDIDSTEVKEYWAERLEHLQSEDKLGEVTDLLNSSLETNNKASQRRNKLKKG